MQRFSSFSKDTFLQFTHSQAFPICLYLCLYELFFSLFEIMNTHLWKWRQFWIFHNFSSRNVRPRDENNFFLHFDSTQKYRNFIYASALNLNSLEIFISTIKYVEIVTNNARVLSLEKTNTKVLTFTCQKKWKVQTCYFRDKKKSYFSEIWQTSSV